ncbi:MAG: gamma carbonic anhydrase family protein [Actinomycetes bacterium]
MAAPVLLPLGDDSPSVADGAFVAPGATLVGAVRLAAGSSVWFGAVLRADGDTIDIGERSNIQDGCVLHTDPGFPISLGTGVTVGHRAVLHGCSVEDDVLVGMGVVVLNGARVGSESLLAAGTVVLEGTEVPPRSLVAGVPGKVRRQLTDDEVEHVRNNAAAYVTLAARYRR